MARNCKVVTTCFVRREVREESTLAGDPAGPFQHAQNFPHAESVLDLMELTRELELKVDPGVECDTIVVNNDVGWEKGNRYLASLDGTRTFAGKFRVLTRENYGRAFGGHNHAFEQFRGQYDYWTFTEDDILLTGDKWLKRCLETLRDHDDKAFVAIQGLSLELALHAHSSLGTTHVGVLDAVARAWGSLPHRRKHESQRHTDHIIFGEVLFTHLMDRLGYKLVDLESGQAFYTYAYDYIRQTRRPRPAGGSSWPREPLARPRDVPPPGTLEALLQEARDDAAALRASLSWRLTAPLRGALDELLKLRARASQFSALVNASSRRP